MRKHGGPPSRHDKYITLAAISPPGVARGRFVGGHQSGLGGSKSPPLFNARNLFLFVTGATPWVTMGRLSTTECTYPALPNPSGPPPQDPYTQLILPLIVVLLLNCF